MLDPTWSPQAAYAHSLEILAIINKGVKSPKPTENDSEEQDDIDAILGVR